MSDMCVNPSNTLEGMIDAAKKISPAVRERAQLTESLRQIPQETLQDMRDVGLYRMCVPKRYGGMGLDFEAAIRISFELSRACASTGWISSQISFQSIIITAFPEKTQDECWGENPNVGAASANAIINSEMIPVDGGYRLSGRWKFSSGIDQASWLILSQPTRGATEMVLIPRSDVEIVDDWYTVGLKGTGSKEVVIKDAFLPSHRVAPISGIPAYGMSIWVLGGIAWGAAAGAHDDFERMIATRRSAKDLSRPADRDSVQIALADSAATLDCAYLLFERNLAIQRMAESQGRDLLPEELLKVSRDCAFMIRSVYRTTKLLVDEFGSSVIYDSNPIQRALRDVMTVSLHARISWHTNAKKFGMWRLGMLPDLPPFDP